MWLFWFWCILQWPSAAQPDVCQVLQHPAWADAVVTTCMSKASVRTRQWPDRRWEVLWGEHSTTQGERGKEKVLNVCTAALALLELVTAELSLFGPKALVLRALVDVYLCETGWWNVLGKPGLNRHHCRFKDHLQSFPSWPGEHSSVQQWLDKLWWIQLYDNGLVATLPMS